MNTTRSIVRGSVYSGGSVLVSMAAMLVVGKIFTNALDKTGVAVFALLLIWSDFFILAGNCGLAMCLPKLIAGAPAERRARVSGSAVVFQAAVGVVTGAAVLVIWGFFPGTIARVLGNDGGLLAPYLWLLPPLFFVGGLRDTALAALAGFNRYAQRAAGIITAAVAQAALVFIFVWMMRGGVAVLTWTFAAAYALETVWLFIALPRGARWQADLRTAAESVRFSLALYVNTLLTFLFQRFDTVLVVLITRNVEAVALFEIAKRLATMLSRVLGAMLVPYLPSVSDLIARRDTEGAARLLRVAGAAATFFGYMGVLAAVTVQEQLIVALFNADYLGATVVLGLLMTVTCIAVQTGLMGQTLIALGRPGIVTLVNIATAALSVGANFLLLPRMGIQGAAVAALVAGAVSNAAQTFFVRRAGLRVSIPRHLAPHLFMAVAAGIMLLGGGAFPWRVAGAAVFVTLCFVFRLITPAQLRNALTAWKG